MFNTLDLQLCTLVTFIFNLIIESTKIHQNKSSFTVTSKHNSKGVSVCPGPNMAYFSKEMTLKNIVDHIYGRTNEFVEANRPHMFLKELKLYIDYLKNKWNEFQQTGHDKELKYLTTFSENLENGISYYRQLFSGLTNQLTLNTTKNSLDKLELVLKLIKEKILKNCLLPSKFRLT